MTTTMDAIDTEIEAARRDCADECETARQRGWVEEAARRAAGGRVMTSLDDPGDALPGVMEAYEAAWARRDARVRAALASLGD